MQSTSKIRSRLAQQLGQSRVLEDLEKQLEASCEPSPEEILNSRSIKNNLTEEEGDNNGTIDPDLLLSARDLPSVSYYQLEEKTAPKDGNNKNSEVEHELESSSTFLSSEADLEESMNAVSLCRDLEQSLHSLANELGHVQFNEGEEDEEPQQLSGRMEKERGPERVGTIDNNELLSVSALITPRGRDKESAQPERRQSRTPRMLGEVRTRSSTEVDMRRRRSPLLQDLSSSHTNNNKDGEYEEFRRDGEATRLAFQPSDFTASLNLSLLASVKASDASTASKLWTPQPNSARRLSARSLDAIIDKAHA